MPSNARLSCYRAHASGGRFRQNSSGYRSDAETAFQLVFWQRNCPIARDAMDIGGRECSQIFPNSKSSNAVPPRLFIFLRLPSPAAATVVETAFEDNF